MRRPHQSGNSSEFKGRADRIRGRGRGSQRWTGRTLAGRLCCDQGLEAPHSVAGLNFWTGICGSSTRRAKLVPHRSNVGDACRSRTAYTVSGHHDVGLRGLRLAALRWPPGPNHRVIRGVSALGSMWRRWKAGPASALVPPGTVEGGSPICLRRAPQYGCEFRGRCR